MSSLMLVSGAMLIYSYQYKTHTNKIAPSCVLIWTLFCLLEALSSVADASIASSLSKTVRSSVELGGCGGMVGWHAMCF